MRRDFHLSLTRKERMSTWFDGLVALKSVTLCWKLREWKYLKMRRNMCRHSNNIIAQCTDHSELRTAASAHIIHPSPSPRDAISPFVICKRRAIIRLSSIAQTQSNIDLLSINRKYINVLSNSRSFLSNPKWRLFCKIMRNINGRTNPLWKWWCIAIGYI